MKSLQQIQTEINDIQKNICIENAFNILKKSIIEDKFIKENPNLKSVMFDITIFKDKIDNWKKSHSDINEVDRKKVEQFKNQKDIKPVIIQESKTGYKIKDGWHRITAALAQGKKEIPAFVKQTSIKKSNFDEFKKGWLKEQAEEYDGEWKTLLNIAKAVSIGILPI
jgi:hypothetical protein